MANLTEPKFVIRRAEASDVPDLCPLVAEYWQFEGLIGFDEARVSEQLRRIFADESLGAGWIARQAGAAVGYLLGVYVFSLEHLGMTAEIDELYVQPSTRRAGIGSELLRTAEEAFRVFGCTNVSLQLGIANTEAREFYGQNGFRPRAAFGLLEKDLRMF